MADVTDLPPEVQAQALSFFREVDGGLEIADMMGLVRFIAETGTQYPALYSLVNINEDAIAEHYEKTGEIPPGIRMVRKTQESEKVTRLEVLRGPLPPKSPDNSS